MQQRWQQASARVVLQWLICSVHAYGGAAMAICTGQYVLSVHMVVLQWPYALVNMHWSICTGHMHWSYALVNMQWSFAMVLQWCCNGVAMVNMLCPCNRYKLQDMPLSAA